MEFQDHAYSLRSPRCQPFIQSGHIGLMDQDIRFPLIINKKQMLVAVHVQAVLLPLLHYILPFSRMRQIFSVPLPQERLIHVLLHEYSVFMGIKPCGPVNHRNRDSFLSSSYHPGLRKQSSGLLPHLSALRHNLDGRAYFNGFEKRHAGRTGHADASMGLRRHENRAHMHADAAVRQPHEVGHGSVI